MAKACSLEPIIDNQEDCDDVGGWRVGYIANFSDIDWVTMKNDLTKFNPATQEIKGYVMLGSAIFQKVEGYGKSTTYNFEYTSEKGFYHYAISMYLKGVNNTRKNNILNVIRKRGFIFHLFGNNGLQRVVGVHWDGVAFRKILDPLHLSKHVDKGGQLGQGDNGKTQDDIEFQGEGRENALFATVTETAIPGFM
jgi:hypothetical protein